MFNKRERVRYIMACQLLDIINHWKNDEGLKMLIMLNKINKMENCSCKIIMYK